MEPNKTAENYLARQVAFINELTKLRELILATELVETVKWGMPVYTIGGRNVVGIGAFKNYAGLWFFQGSFLQDPYQLLINAQEGKTKGMRQMRFASMADIDEKKVSQYLLEAIENQKQGKEIKAEKKKWVVPEALEEAMSRNALLSEAFDALTPGRQKEYAEYVEEAKQAETKNHRIEKIIPMILAGTGLNDRYKK